VNYKRLVRSAILQSETRLGIERLRDKRWAAQKILPAAVLLFHRVTDDIPEDGITVSKRTFRVMMENLARHYKPISLHALLDHRDRAEMWLPRTVVVTFDDGYRDNYEYAAPILEEFRVPATFFLTIDAIGSERVMPWDEHLKGRVPWMNWSQVLEMHSRGFEIGSHTLTHPDLGQLRGPRAWEEISGSKAKLEDHLGAEAPFFAYPFGRKENFCEENRELARKAGYRCCCSAYGGFFNLASDAFNLQRMGINSWLSSPSDLDFEIRIAAPWRWREVSADGRGSSSG
jgi:peptidoglycan/xylan/chitin deacetylase (PgdA/CDA1 family)